MPTTDQLLADKFVCPRCEHKHATVERLAMSGTGLSRLLEIQAHRYAFVSCTNCGYTEVFNLRVLEGKDNLGSFLEVLFMD
ncbi:zinc ribbon domain-containing protein [bacterium]|nr:zinc ribbon domain-containing protein [bacterium]MCB2179105.1 zinc ribbon domain-containing protein [bacterium]